MLYDAQTVQRIHQGTGRITILPVPFFVPFADEKVGSVKQKEKIFGHANTVFLMCGKKLRIKKAVQNYMFGIYRIRYKIQNVVFVYDISQMI